MKINMYLVVFGAVVLLIVGAWLSTIVFNNPHPAANSITLSGLQNYGPAPQLQGIAGW